MKREEMRAGYSFITSSRVGAYITLTGGILTSIGIGGYFLVNGIIDLFEGKEERAALRLKAEEDIAKRNAELEAAKANYENQVKTLCSRISDEIKVANETCAIALAEVQKVSKEAKNIQPLTLSNPKLTGTTECQAYAEELKQALLWADNLKTGLYASIAKNFNDLIAPLQAEIAKRDLEIAKQEEAIQKYRQEIKDILTKERVIDEPASTILKDYPIYLSSMENSFACQLDSIGDSLVHLAQVRESDLLKKETVRDLSHNVSRLAAWIPTVVNGISKQKRMVVLSENDSTLTPSEKAKIADLHKKIEGAYGMIRAFEKEQAPYKEEKSSLEATLASILQTKETVASNWKANSSISKVAETCNALQNEYSSYPNTILALTSQWDDTIKASLTREADLWCKACENSADNTFKGFSFGGCVLGGAWAVWALLLIIMDFLAAILVTALRAQDIQQLVEKKEN